ncbi:hypothetical protein M0813_12084 [Anaeramoeba flamelloides]|uniref:Uncharacterized protein n=1 Tax=Anaeramoeba flamelloides TaxID=1746091 RepID=A0ABQ8ZDC9_9EUKA|nr:hypothetical protein M0813_12084 [Anaeramoeba flamelloides]
MNQEKKIKAEIVFESDETRVLRNKIRCQEEQEELDQKNLLEREQERKRRSRIKKKKKKKKKQNINFIKIDEKTKFYLFPLDLLNSIQKRKIRKIKENQINHSCKIESIIEEENKSQVKKKRRKNKSEKEKEEDTRNEKGSVNSELDL